MLTFVLFVGTPVAHALTLSPARSELSGDPGTTITGELTLMNEEGYDKTFYSSTKNFEAQGESGTPAFTNADDGLASWIQINPALAIKKDQEIKVPYSISIPKDADPGGYFAAIFFSTVPTNGAKGDVSLGAKIGSLVLLHVNGTVKQDAHILGFTSDKFSYTALPATFSYRFNNNGGDRINPTGDLTIRDTLFITAKKLSANPSQGNVLPGSIRKFNVVWGDETVKETPKNFFAAAGYQWDNFALGLYSARLSLSYGSNSTVHATRWIIVFPWQLVIILIIIITLGLFILGKGLKRYNRWVIKTATSQK